MGWPSLQHLAAVGLRQAGQQADQRGLAAAGETDDGDEFAPLDAQVQVLQHLGARAPLP